MTEPRPVTPVLLICAVFSRHDTVFDWAGRHLENAFGPVGLAGLPFDFVQTTYYNASMGQGLRKRILAFARLVGPEILADVKHRTNALERELASTGTFAEERPVNLDPGMLGLGKLVLATTKDQVHRVYLRDGIFAEATLRYKDGAFQPWPWTYSDYQLPEVLAFFQEARRYYRQRLATSSP